MNLLTTWTAKLLTRKSFRNIMDVIDAELSDADMPFHQRPLHALSKLAEKVDPTGVFEMRDRVVTDPDDFSNKMLCAQVHRWYEERYGDRIKTHMGPGNYVLMIRREHWKVELPLCYGSNHFTVDSDLQSMKRFVTTGKGRRIPSVNILWYVENMTYEIASTLSPDEKQFIFEEFIFALNAVQFLRDLKNAPFMAQAENDYDTALNCIFYKYPNYNNSKWASLQFAEKAMKSVLDINKVPFAKNHDLSTLAGKVSRLGVGIPDQVIANIQCTPAIRYEEERTTRKEAITALQCALALFSDIFRASAFSK